MHTKPQGSDLTTKPFLAKLVPFEAWAEGLECHMIGLHLVVCLRLFVHATHCRIRYTVVISVTVVCISWCMCVLGFNNNLFVMLFVLHVVVYLLCLAVICAAPSITGWHEIISDEAQGEMKLYHLQTNTPTIGFWTLKQNWFVGPCYHNNTYEMICFLLCLELCSEP